MGSVSYRNKFRFLPYPYSLLHDIGVQSELSENELTKLLEKAYELLSLPDTMVQMLKLRYQQHMNIDEIASAYGVSGSTASQKIRDALYWIKQNDEIRILLETGSISDHFSPDICTLKLPYKTERALREAGWCTVADLIAHIDEIRNLKDVGTNSIEQTKVILAEKGYTEHLQPAHATEHEAVSVLRYLLNNKRAMNLVEEIIKQDRWDEVEDLLQRKPVR